MHWFSIVPGRMTGRECWSAPIWLHCNVPGRTFILLVSGEIDTINVAGYECIASLGCYGHSAVEEATKRAVEDTVQSETIAAKAVPAADRAVDDAATRTQNKSLAYVHRELLLDISEWLRFLCQSQVSLGQFERHVIILT